MALCFHFKGHSGNENEEREDEMWYLCCFISQVSWNNFASLSSIHHHELGSSKPQRVSLVGNLTSKNEKKTIICFGLLHLCLLIAYSVGGWRPILALINQFPLQKRVQLKKWYSPFRFASLLFWYCLAFGKISLTSLNIWLNHMKLLIFTI